MFRGISVAVENASERREYRIDACIFTFEELSEY